MRKIKQILVLVVVVLMCLPVINAKLRVVTSYGYIADIVKNIGGDRVNVTALGKGYKDPHFITPRPSFIAKIRKADLLIINGGQLEIGWIPPIIKKANNPDINPGNKGFLDLFSFIDAIDVPREVSRAHGDVHPDGNPHFHLNPENILVISKAIKNKMVELDISQREYFTKRYDRFVTMWKNKINEWKNLLKIFRGKNVVQYHKNFNYFLQAFGFKQLGTLEPVPGIPPTTKHILDMIEIIKHKGAEFIVHDVYHMKKPSEFVSKKTGVKLVVLPHDVGSFEKVKDIVSLFDEIVRRLLK